MLGSPGVGQLSAATILAETGTDLDSFRPLTRWRVGQACVQVIGTVRSIQKGPQTTNGNPYLYTPLVQGAWAATRIRRLCFFGPAFND
jgi:hypothetical protein